MDGFIVSNFVSVLKMLDIDPALYRVLTRLCCMHALHRIIESAGEFIQVKLQLHLNK